MNHFWQNWPKTRAYVASSMCFPTSLAELSAAVRFAERNSLPVRAVGGGWSFSDASQPGNIVTLKADVAAADQLTRWLPRAEGFKPPPGPWAAIIDPTDGTLIGYDANDVGAPGAAVPGAANLDAHLGPPQPDRVCLINTRALKGSLQHRLDRILSPTAKNNNVNSDPNVPGVTKHYFHVECGITIEELSALLDAQSPRLQLDASGGNPGATLAGSISTGTHGAEFNSALLVDRVKAIHFVGPGGLQWWIEGDDPVADPAALLAEYPCLDRSRIITGVDIVSGATGQQWLDAVVVSMGCMGAIYSVVLEVSELTGMRQVVSQTTWWRVLTTATNVPVPIGANGKPMMPMFATLGLTGENQLRIPMLNPTLSSTLTMLLTGGTFSTKLLSPAKNSYADLAFNPNRRSDGDLDCWIVNREDVAISFDPQPPPSGGIDDVPNAVFSAMTDAFGGDIGRLVYRLGTVYRFIDPILGAVNQALNPAAPIINSILQSVLPGIPGAVLGQVLLSGNPAPLIAMVANLMSAADKLDVALNELTGPLTRAQATDLATPLLTGILSATLGTAKSNPGITIGNTVGAVGFPSSGIVGAGLEVAMSATAAFPFIQTEILDRMSPQLPFYGYVSVRVCPKTKALLGMPQWNPSVMIEVVSFGDNWGRLFMTTLQTRIVAAILSGRLDAMLHWGLENEQLTGTHLRKIPAMNIDNTRAPFDRVAAFKSIRDNLRQAFGQNPNNLFRAFDSAFTARLGL
jgi:hypothetical protein